MVFSIIRPLRSLVPICFVLFIFFVDEKDRFPDPFGAVRSVFCKSVIEKTRSFCVFPPPLVEDGVRVRRLFPVYVSDLKV